MKQTLEITTPRLILRVPTVEDAVEIHAAMNEVWHELQLWMSWAYDGENSLEALQKNYIDKVLENGALIGRCRVTGKFVIATGITPLEGRPACVETGYWVAKDFLGQGYATESTNACIRYGFNVLGTKEVHIRYYEDNIASQRVIEKLGFTFAETKPKAKARCLDGTLLDVHEYIMTDPTVLPPLEVSWSPSC